MPPVHALRRIGGLFRQKNGVAGHLIQDGTMFLKVPESLEQIGALDPFIPLEFQQYRPFRCVIRIDLEDDLLGDGDDDGLEFWVDFAKIPAAFWGRESYGVLIIYRRTSPMNGDPFIGDEEIIVGSKY